MRLSTLLCFGLCLSLLPACGPKLNFLTDRLVDDMGWSEPELQRIQFYLSEDVVLQRELRSGQTVIRNGQVRVINGREVEQIVFRKNTPGVFAFSPADERIAVSFEDDDSNYLVFGPNPRNADRYTLLAKDWQRDHGTVSYAGREWRVGSADAFAALMIPLKRIREGETRGRVVGGRRL